MRSGMRSKKRKRLKAPRRFYSNEAPTEVGVNLKEGYNGDLTSRQAGSIGGQMVKKMIESYEQQLANQG